MASVIKANKMKEEDLLKPRFKVIADYPGNPFKVGEVLHFLNTDGEEGTHAYHEYGNELQNWMHLEEFEKYPHLFKKLEWWEVRKPEDMPQYVKTTNTRKVYEVKQHTERGVNIDWHNWNLFPYSILQPATELEYLNQKQL